MNQIQKYISIFSLAVVGWVSGQYSATTHYASMYENQASAGASSNPSTKETLSNASPKEVFDYSLSQLMSDPVLRNASWGFVLYDPKTNKILSSYNETTPLIPASTTKLLTTDTALSLLGSKFRWVTQLEYSGSIDAEGTLNGNLYIIGSGDPSLGTNKAGASTYGAIASDFLYAIKEKGIKKITGDIILQTAVFKENKLPTLPANIVWLEHQNYFLPVGSTQDIDPRKEKSVVSKRDPFSNKKQYFYISPYTQKLVYADEFDGAWTSTQIAPTPQYLANLLKANLAKSGIVAGKVTEKLVDREPESRTKITAYHSPMLKDIVYDINQRSDNALSEALLKTVGFQKDGDQTINRGRSVVVEHLRDKNFDTSDLVYMDGSGLSRNHRVTPISQVKFLSAQMKESYYKDFFDSLPIAGQTGTLKKRFFGEAYGQVFAKTGTLNKVKTLAGYVKTRSGKTLAFSFLVNNYAGSVDQVNKKMEYLLDQAINL